MKELSKRSEYYLPKDRILELKYFCRQYPIWQAEYFNCILIPGAVPEKERVEHSIGASDVEKTSERREKLKEKMDMVIEASKQCDEQMGKYIFKGVTSGLSYDELWKKTEIPMSRRNYYYLLHKFYCILDAARK